MKKNYGLNLKKELADRKPEDYQLGGTKKECVALIPNEVRQLYLPEGELQNIGEEKMDCVSRGFNNNLEAKFNYLLRNNLIPQTHLEFLQKNGYITPKGIEFSDAFVAINSQTTREGNSLIAPIDAIHHSGLVPKSLLPQFPAFEEYHNPMRITQAILNLGLEFLTYFSINYERVKEAEFKEFLKKDMIVLGGFAWPEAVNGVYPKTGNDFNHCYLDFSLPCYMAFDNYEEGSGDFIKKLAEDYDQTDFGYRTIVSLKELKKKQKEQSWWQELWEFLWS